MGEVDVNGEENDRRHDINVKEDGVQDVLRHNLSKELDNEIIDAQVAKDVHKKLPPGYKMESPKNKNVSFHSKVLRSPNNNDDEYKESRKLMYP
ncbi:hypothetical protein CR513_52263, partial [Mucuna pruriens]